MFLSLLGRRPDIAPGWYPIEGRPGYWYWNGSRWSNYRADNPPHYGPTPRKPFPYRPALTLLAGLLALLFGLGLADSASGVAGLLLVAWIPLVIGGGLWLLVRLISR